MPTPATQPPAAKDIVPLEAELLYEIDAEIGRFIDIGAASYGHRRYCPVVEGRFEGPRLRGTVLPHGGEWALTTADGVGRMDVRMLLQTDDGATIATAYPGVMVGEPELIRQAFLTGEVDPARYYMRILPRFETGDARYAWLQGIVAIGYGRLAPGRRVRYSVYRIL